MTDMVFVNRLAQAYSEGIVSQESVCHAIATLPCYALNALQPGRVSCQKTRESHELEKVTGEMHPALPNTKGEFSFVCLNCPVFAPALIQILAAMPKR